MKRMIVTISIAMLALLLPGTGSPVSAQFDSALKVKIPFSFSVCRETLPAGTYTIKHPTTGGQTLLIQNVENKKLVDVACVNDIQASKALSEAKLIFNRYGDQYFLAEAWWSGTTSGHGLVKSEKEQTLIKESGADKAKKPEQVIIKPIKVEKSN